MKTIKIIVTIIFIFSCFLSNLAFAQNSVQIEPVPTCINGYYLYVEGKPFLVRGVIYNPTPIGKGYDYDFFADPAKPWLADGKLMKELGINCVRLYTVSKDIEKTRSFIRDMYEKFGIYTIVGDWLGLWETPAANYADDAFKAKTKERVLATVSALKDEKGVLMWILGNENDYTFSGNVRFWTSPEIDKLEPGRRAVKRAEIYYAFVEDLTIAIKNIDTIHPVALGSGEINFLRVAANYCKSIDALAIIFYRGKTFSNVFNSIRTLFDKPILISEFGCDSFDAFQEKDDEDVQAQYLLSQWKDLYANTICSGNKEGNCLGGVMFEWTDEWWKHNEGYSEDWAVHNKEAGWSQGAYTFDNRAKDGLNMNEEWFGILSISEEVDAAGINKRVPKKAFSVLKAYFSSLPDYFCPTPSESGLKSSKVGQLP
ncbi:MAG: hypothetical protein PHQ96_03530 [Candidatus Omnitrophica bacterium]|nr:hypothetical protein [Candidatus Omnitrophota bacterium]